MIYDMVLDSITNIRYRWFDLRDSFQQLAGQLRGNNAAAGLVAIFDNDGSNSGNSLVERCETEAENLRLRGESFRFLRPAYVLFSNGMELLDTTDKILKNQVILIFDQAAKTLPDDLPSRVSTELTACWNQVGRLQEAISQRLQEFEEITTIQGERYVTRGIRNSVENLTAYPVQTMDVEGITPAQTSQPGGIVNLQKMVENVVRKTLGRLPRLSDTRSFLAALNQSFDIVEIENRTEVVWKPRSFAGQTELGGGVAGAQASLYTRAKVAFNNAIPLLDGLYSLRNESDPELISASRSIIFNQFQELVDELGVEGGPRVARVNGLFNTLLGPEKAFILSRRVGGILGTLKADLGLNTSNVNTLEEETNLTNFIAFSDYLLSLRDSWINYRDNAMDGKDLGTQLVLLSRALSVVSESVVEVLSAMDSVFVGPAERQVAFFYDNEDKLFVSELFAWIEDFANYEATELIHQAGRRGVEAIIPTTRQLEALVLRLIQSIPQENSLPEGLRHPRVLHPLAELHAYLQSTADLAEKVQLDVVANAPASARSFNGSAANGGFAAQTNGFRNGIGVQPVRNHQR